MPQDAAGTPYWVVFAISIVHDSLRNIDIYIDAAIGFDETPTPHPPFIVATLAALFAWLRRYQLTLLPPKNRSGTATVDFIGSAISPTIYSRALIGPPP